MVDAKAIKDKLSKKANTARTRVSSNLPSHKHCKMCGLDIDVKSDPRICKNQECLDKLEKHGKNDRMMRIMFFVFFIAVVAPVALALVGIGR